MAVHLTGLKGAESVTLQGQRCSLFQLGNPANSPAQGVDSLLRVFMREHAETKLVQVM